MDYTFNKTLLVILSLFSLLLSSNAIPSTRVIDFISASVPAAAPKSSFIDSTSTSFPAKVDPEILKICFGEQEETNKHCIETLSKLFEGPFDIVKALEIEVNATLGLVKSFSDTFVKLLNDPSTNKSYIMTLNTCREQCDFMLDAINRTLEVQLPRQNFVDAYNSMCSVLSYKSACEASWEMGPGYPDVETPWDSNPLVKSTVICVDILHSIVNNHKI